MDRPILIHKHVKTDFYFFFFMYGAFNKTIFQFQNKIPLPT